jgi:hypothetical protein
MRYVAPSLPVDISLNSGDNKSDSKSESPENIESLLKLLESKKSK